MTAGFSTRLRLGTPCDAELQVRARAERWYFLIYS